MTQQKRDVFHVTVEGNEDWQPTIEDMQQVRDLFMDAALAPSGESVIVTRQGIEVHLDVESVQEGEQVDLISVTVSNAYLDQTEAAEPHEDEILEIFPVGKIEGHRIFCAYDEEIFVDVDAEYISKHPLNRKGFYVTYGDGREDFLVPAQG